MDDVRAEIADLKTYYQDGAGSRNNRVYCYIVVAFNAVGSAASNEVCVVTEERGT